MQINRMSRCVLLQVYCKGPVKTSPSILSTARLDFPPKVEIKLGATGYNWVGFAVDPNSEILGSGNNEVYHVLLT